MIGPESISGTTKCTVAPCIFAPASSARLCVSRPLKAGSRAGWMLSMRSCHCPTKPRRQQPHEAGEADEIDAVFLEHRLQRALESGAVLAKARVVDDFGGDAGGARGRQVRRRRAGWKRPARSRPDSPSSFAASISAAMLEPRPEIRTATRLRLMHQLKIEFAVIDDARLAGGAHHFADGHAPVSPACVKACVDRVGVLRRGDRRSCRCRS